MNIKFALGYKKYWLCLIHRNQIHEIGYSAARRKVLYLHTPAEVYQYEIRKDSFKEYNFLAYICGK